MAAPVLRQAGYLKNDSGIFFPQEKNGTDLMQKRKSPFQMKKIVAKTALILLIASVVSCKENNTEQGSDTSGIPPVADTMPVVHPPNQDSNGVMTTPPTNDSIAIMPDSAIKNK